MSNKIADRPFLIGQYWNGSRYQFLPLANDEIGRTEWFYRGILDRFKLPKRSQILLISKFEDGAFTWPLERGLIADNFVLCYAEATSFDAGRVESFLRRFDVPVVMGATIETLNGLEALGHSLSHLFAGRIIFATDEKAFAKLSEVPHITLRRWYQVGPAPAMECIEGAGLHVDSLEWRLDAEGSEVVVSSRLDRNAVFSHEKTGVVGIIENSPCRCGSNHPRVLDPRRPG